MVSRKEQALLFLCSGETQSLRPATVTKTCTSGEKPTCSFYRVSTGTVEQKKAVCVLPQQSLILRSDVISFALPYAASSRHTSQSLQMITCRAQNFLSIIREPSAVTYAAAQAQFQKKGSVQISKEKTNYKLFLQKFNASLFKTEHAPLYSASSQIRAGSRQSTSAPH